MCFELLMPILTLNEPNHAQLHAWLRTDALLVACLCAAWCDVCRDYRGTFERLAQRFPQAHFVWIDIEDQADLLGDFEVDNFPTLLIQRGDHVAFFGSVPPAPQLAERLVQAQADRSLEELAAETRNSVERQRWQREIHLRRRLADNDSA